jgi:hypothetical protein
MVNGIRKSPKLPFSIFHRYIEMAAYKYIYIWKLELPELPYVCCKQKRKTEVGFHLSANEIVIADCYFSKPAHLHMIVSYIERGRTANQFCRVHQVVYYVPMHTVALLAKTRERKSQPSGIEDKTRLHLVSTK